MYSAQERRRHPDTIQLCPMFYHDANIILMQSCCIILLLFYTYII